MTETHDDVFDEIDKQVADKQNLPTTAPEIAPLPMLPIGDGQPDFLYHNFDGDKMRKWQLVAFATGSEVSSGDEWAGKEFDLKYWLIRRARAGWLFSGIDPIPLLPRPTGLVMSKQTYNESELTAIVDHLDHCIAAATKAAMRYQDLEGDDSKIDFIKQNRKYWKAVCGGLHWSKQMAIATRKGGDATIQSVSKTSEPTIDRGRTAGS